jgi:tol-pal system protein YbgF
MAAFDLKLPIAMKPHFSLSLMFAALVLPSAAAAQQGSTVYMEDRINQLQQTITLLTGQMEQLQYSNQQLQQQMEKMQTDFEFRLDQLEKGRSGGGAPPRPAPPAPPPSANAGSAGGANGATAAGADQLYQSAFKMLQDGDYTGAERAFKTFVQKYPQHMLAGNAQYWLGETYYARRDYQSAMAAFAEGYKAYRASPKGPDNLLKLGITLAVLGRKPDACAVFARFAQDYPKATDLQRRRVDQERQRNACS